MDIANIYEFIEGQPTGASPAELQACEEKHGLKLPEDFKEFYAKFNGFKIKRGYDWFEPLQKMYEMDPQLKLLAFGKRPVNRILCGMLGWDLFYHNESSERIHVPASSAPGCGEGSLVA